MPVKGKKSLVMPERYHQIVRIGAAQSGIEMSEWVARAIDSFTRSNECTTAKGHAINKLTAVGASDTIHSTVVKLRDMREDALWRAVVQVLELLADAPREGIGAKGEANDALAGALRVLESTEAITRGPRPARKANQRTGGE